MVSLFEIVVKGSLVGSDGRQSLLFWVFSGWREPENTGVVEANPDDAAVENSGTGVTTPWPFICHAQLENPSEGTASASVFLIALSCQQKIYLHQYQQPRKPYDLPPSPFISLSLSLSLI